MNKEKIPAYISIGFISFLLIIVFIFFVNFLDQRLANTDCEELEELRYITKLTKEESYIFIKQYECSVLMEDGTLMRSLTFKKNYDINEYDKKKPLRSS